MELRERLLAELHQQVPTLGRLSAQRLTERVLELVESFFPPLAALKPGQLKWPAIRSSDGPGRRVEHTTLQPVTLDLALAEPWAAHRQRHSRSRVAVALFEQAKAQGALLTHADVGAILCSSYRTVASHVKAYQRTNGKVVPARGIVHDIGPGITHRLIICEKLLVECRSVEQTASDTHHSVRAVSRYLKAFNRVRFCLEAGLTPQQTAYLTRLSPALVGKYQALRGQISDRLSQQPDRPSAGGRS